MGSEMCIRDRSVDYTHVLVNGKIAANGDGSLVEEINVNGYERFEKMAEA